jgi:hypothetical protein
LIKLANTQHIYVIRLDVVKSHKQPYQCSNMFYINRSRSIKASMLTSKHVLVLAQNAACVYSSACFFVRSPQPDEHVIVAAVSEHSTAEQTKARPCIALSPSALSGGQL